MQSQLRQIHSAHRPMLLHGLGTQRPQHISRCVKTNASADTSQPKRILITGGNQGIGFQTARQLSLKGHDVVIACRDPTRAREAIAKIKEEKPGALVSSIPLDLSSLASVRDCAARVMDDGRPLDVLLNNAGVMATPKMQTQDGFEFQLGTNHLGHFTLTNLLLPALVASQRPVRIIFVASESHKSGSIKFDDLMRDKPGAYVPWEAYGQSKLANIMTTYELAKRLNNTPQITVNALHPGLVRTELGKYMLKDPKQWWMVALFPLASAFFKPVEEGAATSVYLAASPDVENVTSKYFMDCKAANSSPASYDAAVARKLWEVSQELTKVDTLASASIKA